ncbi:MAG TPA: hypothetical protein VJW73_15010 [Gemmatimonadaceae bacterium]|nr:hypothetical protein [Gemmatimonadaceae bacterium]
MSKLVKRVGGFFVALVVLILAKFKAAGIFAVKVLIVSLIHSAMGKDTTTTASASHPKPARQVAQAVPSKPNPADKLAGPMAPATSQPAVTPSAPLGAGAIQAARNAAAAQNNQLAKETGQDVPAPKGAKPAAAQQPAPTPSPATAPATQNTQVVQQGAPKPTTTASTNADATVMRETFDYTRDTRRDPFVSLMTTSDLRPTLTDLRLTGILYDLSGRRPVAILRDIAGGQWRVTTGMTLGRMRVAQIKPKTIIFTIEEFGFNRQDSLLLGDTTRVRHR